MIGLYARVSTDDQNVKQQVNYLREYCLRNGWTYRSYVDDGVSGEISKRPSWVRLLNDCVNGHINTILVTKFDRVTRDLSYSIEFLDWLKRYDVKLVSVFDGGEFKFSPDSIFTFKLKCLLSEHELAVLRWRSAIGIERAKKEGKYLGRKKGSKNKN
jgi:DNA invertase Pin-like site-specific DNA recombinase